MLAGGTGSRMGRPKQFLDLLGEPALSYSLRAFEKAPGVERIYAVGDADRIDDLADTAGITKYAGCTPAGDSRPLSARNGLLYCDEVDDTIILIHDGSRCLVTPELIERVLEAARGGVDGVVPAVSVSDTIKVSENGTVTETLDRSRLHAVQTPQAFRLGLLRSIYGAPEEELSTVTDDATLVEHRGGRVEIVPGEKTNIKLTSPEDLILAEAILRSRAGARSGEPRGVRR